MGERGFALLAVVLGLAVALVMASIAVTRISQGALEATTEWREAQGEALLYGGVRELLYPRLLSGVRSRIVQAAASDRPAEEIARRAAEALNLAGESLVQATGPGGVPFRAWIYLHGGVAAAGNPLPPGETLPRASLLGAYPGPQGAKLVAYSLPLLVWVEIGQGEPLRRKALKGAFTLLWGRGVPQAWSFGLHGEGAPAARVETTGHAYLRRPPLGLLPLQASGILATPGCMDISHLACTQRRQGIRSENGFTEALASPGDPLAPCVQGGCFRAPLGLDWQATFLPITLSGQEDFTLPSGARVNLTVQGGEQRVEVGGIQYRLRQRGGIHELLQGSVVLASSPNPLRLRIPSPARISGVLAEGASLLLVGGSLTLGEIIPERDPCQTSAPLSCQPSTALLTIVADSAYIPAGTMRIHAVVFARELRGENASTPVAVVGSVHSVEHRLPRPLHAVHNPASVDAPLLVPGGTEGVLAVALSPLTR